MKFFFKKIICICDDWSLILRMKRIITREDILKSGLQLMFVNGYNATGIREIQKVLIYLKVLIIIILQTKKNLDLKL